MTKKASILIAEDNDEIAAIITAYLQHDGYQTYHTKDGEHALTQFVLRKPDVVILDINMPGISGIAALQKMKGMKDVPVIMLTASDDQGLREQSIRAGANAYMNKPFVPAELLLLIKKVLESFSC